MRKNIVIIILVFFINGYGKCFGQLKPMGFTQEIILPVPNKPYEMYYPRISIINDTLFVCSNTGIYQKDLKQDSEWELFAFEGVVINEFIKKENDILAISPGGENQRDSLLLLSQDNGKTYIDYTPSFLFEEENNNHLHRISQNPQNPNSILLIHRYGVSLSYDYGINWNSFYRYGFLNLPSINYLPSDTTTIFYAGEMPSQAGMIKSSYDGGKTWSEYLVPGGDNCVHHIAFHPTNPNILVFSGEGVIGKSIDKGQAWNISEVYDWGYLYKILFDEETPAILYTSSFTHANEKIHLYRSTDTGETWHLAYEEMLDTDCWEVIDILKYKNKIVFYTWKCGLFELDLDDLPPVSIPAIENIPELTLYPNPVINTIHFETAAIISRVDIMDMAGKLVLQTHLTKNEKTVDASHLNDGIYLAVFHSINNKQIIKKICISHQP